MLDSLPDVGMDEGIEIGQGLWVTEYHRAEHSPVQVSAGVEHVWAEAVA